MTAPFGLYCNNYSRLISKMQQVIYSSDKIRFFVLTLCFWRAMLLPKEKEFGIFIAFHHAATGLSRWLYADAAEISSAPLGKQPADNIFYTSDVPLLSSCSAQRTGICSKQLFHKRINRASDRCDLRLCLLFTDLSSASDQECCPCQCQRLSADLSCLRPSEQHRSTFLSSDTG